MSIFQFDERSSYITPRDSERNGWRELRRIQSRSIALLHVLFNFFRKVSRFGTSPPVRASPSQAHCSPVLFGACRLFFRSISFFITMPLTLFILFSLLPLTRTPFLTQVQSLDETITSYRFVFRFYSFDCAVLDNTFVLS